MQKLSVFTALMLTVLLFACSKKESEDPGSFALNGIHSVGISPNQDSTLPLEIKHLTGKQQQITLSVVGLPGEIKVSIEPSEGVATFYSNLTITGLNAIKGSYTGKIIASFECGTLEYPITVDVVDPLRSDLLLGTWIYTGAAEDENGNRIPDPAELVSDPTSSLKYEFFVDKTGRTTSISPGDVEVESFQWALINDDSQLMLTFSNELLAPRIYTLDENNLVLVLDSILGTRFIFFERQL